MHSLLLPLNKGGCVNLVLPLLFGRNLCSLCFKLWRRSPNGKLKHQCLNLIHQKIRCRDSRTDDHITCCLWCHKWIPISISSHPRPKRERCCIQWKPWLTNIRQGRINTPQELGKTIINGFMEICQPLPRLILWCRLFTTNLVRPPRSFNLTPDFLQTLDTLIWRHPRVVQPAHLRPDLAVLFQQTLPRCLRGMRREDQLHILIAQGLVNLFRRHIIHIHQPLQGLVRRTSRLFHLTQTLGLFQPRCNDFFRKIMQIQQLRKRRGHQNPLVRLQSLQPLLQHFKVSIRFAQRPSLCQTENHIHLVGNIRVMVSENLRENLSE
mmetsp:Transcript_10832/g.21558  ORF Transcript_10832/g.21558 Transcript_10832/m.21558 type:complete len:322 (-) Transcript_10832:123-1088(-)